MMLRFQTKSWTVVAGGLVLAAALPADRFGSIFTDVVNPRFDGVY